MDVDDATQPTSPRPTAPRPRTAPLVALAVLAVLVVVAVVWAVGAALRTGAPGDAAPDATDAPGGLVVSAHDASGAVLTGDAADDLETVLLHRLGRAGIEHGGVTRTSDGGWAVTLPDGAAPEAVTAAAQVLAAPLDGGVARVLAVGRSATGEAAGPGPVVAGTSPLITADVLDAFGALDCHGAAGAVRLADGVSAVCDLTSTMTYLLGDVEVPLADVTDVTVRPDAVEIAFDDNGARRLAELTGTVAGLPAPENQVAVVAAGEVLTAPQVQQAIAGGVVWVGGNGELDDVVTSSLRLAAAGARLDVAAIG